MPKALTELGIAQLKPGKSRREISDAAFEGLSIIVHPTGAKTWSYRYRYARRLRRITIGNWPAIDIPKARRRAETALGALERGEDPTIALFAPKSSQYILRADRDSFGVLIRSYFQKHLIPNTRSWRESARLVGLKVEEAEGNAPTFADVHGGIVERFAERPVTSITRKDLREMIEASRERGATTTINREVGVVRAFLQWCVNADIIETNPAAGMAKASPENKRTRVLTETELRLIWLAAESEAFPFGDIVRLLLLTGQRRGEVAGAAWPEFDLKAQHWLLPAERSKNGLPHLIPLAVPAIEILQSIPRFAGGDFMFGMGGRNGFSGFSKAKRRLDETITELNDGPLPEWDIHDLRRSVATGMAKLGVQPIVIEASLNHITGVRSSIASVYNLHSYEQEKREALTRWAEHVLRVVDPDFAETTE
jgi:integrase